MRFSGITLLARRSLSPATRRLIEALSPRRRLTSFPPLLHRCAGDARLAVRTARRRFLWTHILSVSRASSPQQPSTRPAAIHGDLVFAQGGPPRQKITITINKLIIYKENIDCQVGQSLKNKNSIGQPSPLDSSEISTTAVDDPLNADSAV